MIRYLLLFSSHSFPITIDRVEDDQAVVEWKDGSLTSLPTYLFPIEVYEGQSWFLHIQKTNKISHHKVRNSELAQTVSNYPAYLYQHNAIISLPHPTVLPLGSSYHIYFTPIRGTYAK